MQTLTQSAKGYMKYSLIKVPPFQTAHQKRKKKESRSWLLYPKRISYIQYKEAKRLPVFNLNKYKGGFHEQAFNQRKSLLAHWQCVHWEICIQI